MVAPATGGITGSRRYAERARIEGVGIIVTGSEGSRMGRGTLAWAFLVMCVSMMVAACGTAQPPVALKEVQRVRSGAIDVVVLSPTGALAQGKSAFVLEFRGADGTLLDVGTVTVTATMVMAGMAPMFGESTVAPGDVKGRYEITCDLGMAGTWRLSVEWNGPAGHGSALVPGTIR